MKYALVLLAACGSEKPPGPCERGGTIELRRVDHDAPFMKQIYAHVGADREGVATEPGAAAAGITVEIDAWRKHTLTDDDELPVEDGPQQTDYYVKGADRAALLAYLATLEKLPDDRELRIQHVVPPIDARDPRPYFRTYYLVKQPIFDGSAVADVRETENKRTGDPLVGIYLTADGKERLRAASAAASKLGAKLAVLVDGEVINAPVVQETIPGGWFSIISHRRQELDGYVKKLACVTSRGR